jgi:hypothetical protein
VPAPINLATEHVDEAASNSLHVDGTTHRLDQTTTAVVREIRANSEPKVAVSAPTGDAKRYRRLSVVALRGNPVKAPY